MTYINIEKKKTQLNKYFLLTFKTKIKQVIYIALIQQNSKRFTFEHFQDTIQRLSAKMLHMKTMNHHQINANITKTISYSYNYIRHFKYWLCAVCITNRFQIYCIAWPERIASQSYTSPHGSPKQTKMQK